MKIVIFGAAGATGRIVVERALEQGHEVTAFDRHTAPLTIQHPKLKLVQGDIFNLSQVEAAIAGQDAVISVLGVGPGITIPVCSEGTKNIIAAMQKSRSETLYLPISVCCSGIGWRMARGSLLTVHLALLSKSESHVCR